MKQKELLRLLQQRSRRKARKAAKLEAIALLSANEIAARIRKTGQDMLHTPEWRALRKRVIDAYGRRCMKCGYIPKRGECVNVDHIKPRMHFPELTWEFSNLQVLCPPCNQKKGNTDWTDYRPRIFVEIAA